MLLRAIVGALLGQSVANQIGCSQGAAPLSASECDIRCRPDLRAACGAYAQYPSATFYSRDAPGLTPQLEARVNEFMNCTQANVIMYLSGVAGWKQGFIDDIGTLLMPGPGLFDGYLTKGAWVPPISNRLADLSGFIRESSMFQWNDILPAIKRIVSFNQSIKAVPADGDFIHSLIRNDLLEKHGKAMPETLEELIEVAEYFQDKDLNDDGVPDYGNCNSFDGGYMLNAIFMYHISPIFQSEGTSQGVYFNPQTMRPFFKTEAAEYAFRLYKRFLDAGTFYYAISSGSGIVFAETSNSKYFLEGRCAIYTHFPGPLKDVARGKMERRDEIGEVVWQAQYLNGTYANAYRLKPVGSKYVLNQSSGKLHTCDEKVCPFGLRLARNGWVNHAPFLATGGYVLSISEAASTPRRKMMFDFFAYIVAPAQSTWDVGYSHMDPFRFSHLSQAARQDYLAQGWGEKDIDYLYNCMLWSLSHSNGAMDMSMYKEDLYQSALSERLLALGTGTSISQTMEDLYKDWEDITETYGRIRILTSYRESLSLPPLPEADLCTYLLAEANELYGPERCQSFISCGPGEGYDLSQTKCSSCLPGYFSIGGVDGCRQCPLGRFSSSLAADKCASCLPGTYSHIAGLTACELCSHGSFTPDIDASTCMNCSVGSSSADWGASACHLCAKGKFQAFPGKSACSSCIESFVTGRWDDDHKEMQSFEGAVSLEDCTCDKGTFLNRRSEWCISCADRLGYHCAGGLGLPEVAESFYAEAVGDANGRLGSSGAFSSLRIWRCPVVGNCIGVRSQGQCPEHMLGFGCSLCEAGYTRSSDGLSCISCSAGGGYAIFVTLTVLLFALSYMFSNGLWQEHYSPVAGGKNILIGLIGQVISIVQFTVILSTMQITWPPWFRITSESLGGLTMLFLDLARVSCIIGNSMQFRLLAQVLAPLLLFIILGATMVLVNSILAPLIRAPVMNLDGTAKALVSGLLILYVATCKSTFSYLECASQPSASDTLLKYPYVSCWSGEHIQAIWIFIISCMFNVIGTWVLLCFTLWKLPALFAGPNKKYWRKMLSFLVAKWRPTLWFWSQIYLTRNLLVSLVAVFEPNDGFLQIFLISSFVTAPLLMTAFAQPWRHKWSNFSDVTLTWIFVLLAVATAALVSDNVEPEEFGSGPAQAILACLCIMFLVVVMIVVGAGVWEMYKWRMQPGEEIERLSKSWHLMTKLLSSLESDVVVAFFQNIDNSERESFRMCLNLMDLLLLKSRRTSREIRRIAPVQLDSDFLHSYRPTTCRTLSLDGLEKSTESFEKSSSESAKMIDRMEASTSEGHAFTPNPSANVSHVLLSVGSTTSAELGKSMEAKCEKEDEKAKSVDLAKDIDVARVPPLTSAVSKYLDNVLVDL